MNDNTLAVTTPCAPSPGFYPHFSQARWCWQDARTNRAPLRRVRRRARQTGHVPNHAAEREGIDISRYNEPEAHYEFARKDKTWFVAFDGRVAMPGNHFSVSVDDQTGEAQVFRGR